MQTHFHQCHTPTFQSSSPVIDCAMFTDARSRSASTVSLSILVVIEMLNAANALSASESLLSLPVWANTKLVAAVALSLALHAAIIYVPVLRDLFGVEALGWGEWTAVMAFSGPVM